MAENKALCLGKAQAVNDRRMIGLIGSDKIVRFDDGREHPFIGDITAGEHESRFGAMPARQARFDFLPDGALPAHQPGCEAAAKYDVRVLSLLAETEVIIRGEINSP